VPINTTEIVAHVETTSFVDGLVCYFHGFGSGFTADTCLTSIAATTIKDETEILSLWLIWQQFLRVNFLYQYQYNSTLTHDSAKSVINGYRRLSFQYLVSESKHYYYLFKIIFWLHS
jgi:hypothetical protein